MRKRGQVTIFILIGILILGIVLGMVYLSQHLAKEKLEVEEEAAGEAVLMKDSVRMFVEDCLRESITDGIYLVSSRGGYYQFLDVNLFDFTEENKVLELPYYFYGQEKELPSLEFIEEETGKAAEDFFVECVDGFRIFEEKGYQINEGERGIDIEFGEKATSGELNLPLEIIKRENKVELDRFFSQVDVAVPEKYEIITSYFTEQEKEPNYFLAGDFAWLAYDKDFNWGFKQYQEDGSDIVVNLEFDERVKEEPLVFSFALNFDWAELDKGWGEEVTFEPELQLKRMEDWDITERGIASYQVEAEGMGLIFSADTDDFEINSETGLITLDPQKFENDEYLYYIKVTDIFDDGVMGPLIISINVEEENFPVIEPIQKQTAYAGEEFYYKVEAINPSGGSVLFVSHTYLFDIDKKTGEIRFTPTVMARGVHSVKIDVENEYGKTWERFELEVK